MSDNQDKMCLVCRIEGNAVTLVADKIKEKKEVGIKKYGKSVAIQALLNELYVLKYGGQLRA